MVLRVSFRLHHTTALWQFNEQQARARAERSATTAVINPETPEEAACRLLFERATLSLIYSYIEDGLSTVLSRKHTPATSLKCWGSIMA